MIQYVDTFLLGLLVNLASTLLVTFIYEKVRPQWKIETWRRKGFVLLASVTLISAATAVTITIVIDRMTASGFAEPVFSHFRECVPINDYGVHWGVFNDNPFNGNSNITVEVHHRSDNKEGCYAVLSYYLGDKSTAAPYCGMFSWFAAKPVESRDISRFHGFKMKVWHEGMFPPGVHAYLQISPSNLIRSYDGYFEYDFTDQARQSGTPVDVTAPFEEFRPSTQANIQGYAKLDERLRKNVYQISILLQGEKGAVAQGKLDLDDLRFY